MGYRSEVYIALTKKLYVKCQLLNNIPKCLLDNIETLTTADAVYFFIEGWKWYDSCPETQEMEAWFNWCSDTDENPTMSLYEWNFGAIRLGEGDGSSLLDAEEWGEPAHFELCICSYINRP